jgi:hypothetical protein
VDWFGVSVYWKGANYPYVRNDAVDSSVIGKTLSAKLGGGISTYDFATSHNLPIAFPEFGASYSPDYPGVSNLETKQGMWQQTFSDNAKAAMPSIKLAAWFDYYKYEDDGWRDFTISNYSTVGQLGPALLRDLQSYKGPVYAQGLGLHSKENGTCGCFVKKILALVTPKIIDNVTSIVTVDDKMKIVNSTTSPLPNKTNGASKHIIGVSVVAVYFLSFLIN